MGQPESDESSIQEVPQADQSAQSIAEPSKLLLGDLAAEGVANRNGVTYERWNNVAGGAVSRNSRQAAKLGLPTQKGVAPTLEFPPNDGKFYASRVRGYFVAPRTGSIRFVISSDDNAELWLSPGADPFARRRSAWISGNSELGWTKPGETNRVASQWTSPMQVKQGERYYFEAFHKQADKNDHFSIRMRYEGEKDVASIPTESLRPWVGLATDADDDGLPDEWQRSVKLTGTEDSGSYADADGDGVSNFDEFTAGTGPLDPTPVPGMLLWEAWYGLPGSQVADLVRTDRFSGKPDHSVFVRGGSTPLITAGYCGSRLSGFLVPTESGEYELAVAGDDSTELWISDNESSLRKERVAFGTSWLPKGNWFVGPSQRSKPLVLEAGRSYYFEVIQKDGGPPGWAAIGWKKKGEKSFVEVAPAFLRSPGVPADDINRDFLPDQWVTGVLSRVAEQNRSKIVFTEQGDPDHDGLPNWLEARLGTSPFEKDQVIGTLIREWWLNVPGRSLAASRDAGAFLKRPSMVELSHGASSEAYTADWYASRLRGYVVAPVTGKYRFWVSGDDQAELWLSSDSTKFRKRLMAAVMPEAWESPSTQVHTKRQEWDARRGQKSVVVNLKAGQSYFVELLLKDSGGDDHVAFAWQHCEEGKETWSERGLVESTALLSFEGDEDDIDDDYLPDSWEQKFGLDPNDNGSKDLKKQGEAGDWDEDHLTNREEFLLGTNPCSADTDGDGVGDFDEIKIYGSNPAVKDASPPVIVAKLPLGEAVSTSQRWVPYGNDGAMFSLQLRGTSTWVFEVEKAGVYRVDLSGRSMAPSTPVPALPLSVKVNGIPVGEGNFEGVSRTLSFMTPWLPAGRHEVTVINQNFRSSVTMMIESLTILAQTGDDADDSGIPDWLETYYRTRNRAEMPLGGYVTSPACVEGISRFVENLEIESAGKEIKPNLGIRGGWYANVPLKASGSPTIAKVSYEGGALTEQLELVWKEINLLDGIDVRYVRPGDAVRLTAFESAVGAGGTDVSLSLDGRQLHSGAATEPFVYRFDKEGSFQIKAVATSAAGDSLSTTVTFRVVGAELGADFHVPSNQSRIWTPVDLPAEPVLESDDNLSLVELPSKGSRCFDASFHVVRATSGRVVARLPDGGAIIDTATIHGFFLAGATWTGDYQVVEVLPDGTRVVRLGMIIDGEIPPDLSIWIQMYVPDAVFANGDSWLHLTAADFDDNGRAEFEIFKAPGDNIPYVCHWIRLFGEGPEQGTENTLSATPAETHTDQAE